MYMKPGEWKIISFYFLVNNDGIKLTGVTETHLFTDGWTKSLSIHCNNSALAENGHNDLTGHNDLKGVFLSLNPEILKQSWMLR